MMMSLASPSLLTMLSPGPPAFRIVSPTSTLALMVNELSLKIVPPSFAVLPLNVLALIEINAAVQN